MKSYLTVNDILQRKHFDQIEIVAGKDGLVDQVKWVHIVEVTKIGNLLKGNELILSTAVAWRERKELFISIVQQLIKSNAAGLCIEYGTYTKGIPHEIISMANKANFPIILILKEVPFVEITQDIHTSLINQQYDMLANLEKISHILNKKLLSINHYDELLKVIYEELQVQILLLFQDESAKFYPVLPEIKRENILKKVQAQQEPSRFVVRATIELLGEKFAELIIISSSHQLTEYDQLIVDRTANALAQFFIRELYVEEKRRLEESEWVNSWLEGKETTPSLLNHVSAYLPKAPRGAVVCVYQVEKLENLTYFKLYFRSILEQKGFSFLAVEKHKAIVFILFNERGLSDWKRRVVQAIEKMKQLFSDMQSDTTFNFGIGKYVSDLNAVHESYQTALETIQVNQQFYHRSYSSMFYDDLHIFRIISVASRHMNLQGMIEEYLGPIVEYDTAHQSKLMETLKMYLICNGSKKDTAQKLYIVRQTLYHRLEKIEQLLGSDFMSHEKRLALEFMLLSYDFIQRPMDLKQIK